MDAENDPLKFAEELEAATCGELSCDLCNEQRERSAATIRQLHAGREATLALMKQAASDMVGTLQENADLRELVRLLEAPWQRRHIGHFERTTMLKKKLGIV